MRETKAISKEAAIAFGKVLQAYRTGKGVSQEKLAERSDLHRTYISLLEQGRRQPSLATIILLARALDISASDMVQETEKGLR